MSVSMFKGNSREFWFVLSSESLAWYKDSEVSELTASYSMYVYLSLPCVCAGEGTEVQSSLRGHENQRGGGRKVFIWKEIHLCSLLHLWKVSAVILPLSTSFNTCTCTTFLVLMTY